MVLTVLIVLCMKEPMQSYGRLAQYDSHTQTYTHKIFPYFPHCLWLQILQGVPSLQQFVQSRFLIKRCNYTPLGFHEPGELCLSACSSVFHHVCKSIIVSRLLREEGAINKLEWGDQLRWLNTLHKYMFAHICSCEREGKDNESYVAIATKRNVTPPTPKCCWECVSLFLVCVCLTMLGAGSITGTLGRHPPTATSSSSCRQKNRLLLFLSFICLCVARGPPVSVWCFSSSTWVIHSSLHRIKGELLRTLLRWSDRKYSHRYWLVMCLYTCKGSLKSVSLSFSSCLSVSVRVRWACEWSNNPNNLAAGVYFSLCVYSMCACPSNRRVPEWKGRKSSNYGLPCSAETSEGSNLLLYI